MHLIILCAEPAAETSQLLVWQNFMLRRKAKRRVSETAGFFKAPQNKLYPLCSAEFY
jgi:hypothetical protein